MEIAKVTLDTNAISNLFRGDENVLRLITISDVIFIPIFVIAELHAGFLSGSKSVQNKNILQELENYIKISRIYPGDKTVEIYSEIFFKLRKSGRPIPSNDIWIAALAIEYRSSLITFDHHFSFIDNLDLVNL